MLLQNLAYSVDNDLVNNFKKYYARVSPSERLLSNNRSDRAWGVKRGSPDRRLQVFSAMTDDTEATTYVEPAVKVAQNLTDVLIRRVSEEHPRPLQLQSVSTVAKAATQIVEETFVTNNIRVGAGLRIPGTTIGISKKVLICLIMAIFAVVVLVILILDRRLGRLVTKTGNMALQKFDHLTGPWLNTFQEYADFLGATAQYWLNPDKYKRELQRYKNNRTFRQVTRYGVLFGGSVAAAVAGHQVISVAKKMLENKHQIKLLNHQFRMEKLAVLNKHLGAQSATVITNNTLPIPQRQLLLKL